MLIGVIGKPNTGKSTFFKAATLADAEIANYPFVTIKPNQGVGYVKVKCAESEFNLKCSPKEGFCLKGNRFVPVKLLDVAGLVPGAHKGKGMGNQFLDDLRQADALIHVIDCAGSTNEKGEPVAQGSYDPANDIKFLETELDMWYLSIFQKVWDRFARQVKQEHQDAGKAIAKQFSGLKITENNVLDVISKLDLNKANISGWTEEELKEFVKNLRTSTKPIIIAANKIDVPGADENLKRLKKEFPGYLIIPCSSETELALKNAAKQEYIDYIPGEKEFNVIDESKLNDAQKNAFSFIKNNVLSKYSSTGVQDVLNEAVFNLLNHISVYPVTNSKFEDKDGNILPDCFLVPKGTNAQEFAYHIHTDIGDNFIKAIDMRSKQVISKEQALKNGDIIEIAV